MLKRCLNQQCCNHLPTLSSQNVVSATGRQRIHSFYADALLHQDAHEGGRCKAQTRAAAKNYQLRLTGSQLREMPFGQVFKARAVPVKLFAALTNYDAALDFFSNAVATQSDPAGSVTQYGLDI